MKESDIANFLKSQPEMKIVPSKQEGTIFAGTFKCTANHDRHGSIDISYSLEITVPWDYPHNLPKVREKGDKIPQTPDFHVNPDGTLCLTNPLRMNIALQDEPSLETYIGCFLVPYLYAVTLKLNGYRNGKWVFGELEHGDKGLQRDIIDLFGAKDSRQCLEILRLLKTEKYQSDLEECPCGCKCRLYQCGFRHDMAHWRRYFDKKTYVTKYLVRNKSSHGRAHQWATSKKIPAFPLGS